MAQLLVSIAQIVMAVILGVIAAYLGVVLFNRATRHVDEWAEIRRGNAAMGLIVGSIILGIAFVLQSSLAVELPGDVGNRGPLYVLLAHAAGLIASLLLALIAIVFAAALFDRLTGQIDELAELQRGNLAVAAMLAGVILAVAWLMAGAMGQIMKWFVFLLPGLTSF